MIIFGWFLFFYLLLGTAVLFNCSMTWDKVRMNLHVVEIFFISPFTWSSKLFQNSILFNGKTRFRTVHFLGQTFRHGFSLPEFVVDFFYISPPHKISQHWWRKRRGQEGHALGVGMRDLTSSREFLLWSLAGCSNDTNRVQLPSHACNIIKWSSSCSCQLGLCFQCYQEPTHVFSKEGAIPEMFEKVCFRLYQRVFL